jgi:hypothetical protein
MPARRGTWPLAARGQQADQVRRIGVLLSYIEPDPQAVLSENSIRLGFVL